jgi:hypothetical protein
VHPIEVDVVGYRLVDTIKTAALEDINIFCNQHPMEVAAYPIGLCDNQVIRNLATRFSVKGILVNSIEYGSLSVN